MFGLSFFTRDSGGGLTLVSRHPLSSPTWYWSLSWQPVKADFARHFFKLHISKLPGPHQKHHYLHLLRLGSFVLSTQGYHKNKRWEVHQ